MSNCLYLILGDQLHYNHPFLQKKEDKIIMVESVTELKRRPYHIFKLAYLCTAMREFADQNEIKTHWHATELQNNSWISKAGLHYFTLASGTNFEALFTQAKQGGVTSICLLQPADKPFLTFLRGVCARLNLELKLHTHSPFLTSHTEQSAYLAENGKRRLKMQHFYEWQRKRLGILLNKNNQPVGKKWNLDEENRKKLPKNHPLPPTRPHFQSSHWKTVCAEIKNLFPHSPGQLPETCWLPLNYTQAAESVRFFAENLLHTFGDFEDALTTRDSFVFHSLLSAPLNYGLILPADLLLIVDEVLQERHHFSIFERQEEIPQGLKLNSLEGFIRQIIGWREWVWMLYNHCYEEDLSQYNFFNHTKKLENWWWTLDATEAEKAGGIPLQETFKNLQQNSYNHHIERLMILANWMTLNEYDPLECFEWFRTMYVDALDWVMVANVMGMGLFADGGLFTTKPYVSGGNYIKKMSDYPNSSSWEALWTDKFWNFLLKHEHFFTANPRMRMLIIAYKKRNLDK